MTVQCSCVKWRRHVLIVSHSKLSRKCPRALLRKSQNSTTALTTAIHPLTPSTYFAVLTTVFLSCGNFYTTHYVPIRCASRSAQSGSTTTHYFPEDLCAESLHSGPRICFRNPLVVLLRGLEERRMLIVRQRRMIWLSSAAVLRDMLQPSKLAKLA